MRVSIIGDGAMGLLFASYLSLSADVAVFSRRNERSELRNRNGITVLVKDGRRVFHPVFTTDKSMMAGSELVILFVKSASTVSVIDEYKEFIPDDAYIMTLQNGAGHFEELNAFLFSLGCYAGEPITVVSHLKGGCVVSIKDGRYNIDKQLAGVIEI